MGKFNINRSRRKAEAENKASFEVEKSRPFSDSRTIYNFTNKMLWQNLFICCRTTDLSKFKEYKRKIKGFVTVTFLIDYNES